MSVNISRNAELFHKATEDVWAAEQIWKGAPNLAVWHCTQAAEKTMKGFLRCLNLDYNYGHELKLLLDAVLSVFKLSETTERYIMYLSDFESSLRYKSMSNDPSPEDAKIAISRTKQIMQEFNENPKIAQFMDEAREVHAKILNTNDEL
ncbi:MAG: HEPN domain-containing protein [Oscillospiraceae bacterium]|nr:HEPN domain-containing protein [Oscillospiraceae bacterium]